MNVSESTPARRHYHLGLLALSVEPTVPADRFESWLPRTMNAGDAPSVATLWVGGSDTRDKLGGPGRLVAGGVTLWVDVPADRASLLHRAGHSELDLRDRWGRVAPKDGAGDIGPLLSAGAGLLLGRAGAVLVNASAVIDASGSGWIIAGSRETRSAVTRWFVRDGCDYVSDDQVLIRKARHQPGILLVESWHRSAAVDAARPPMLESPIQKWKPVAVLRGTILSCPAPSGKSRSWKSGSRDRALATLLDSSPYLECDPAAAGPLRELLRSCTSSRPVVEAAGPRADEGARGGALSKLTEALSA